MTMDIISYCLMRNLGIDVSLALAYGCLRLPANVFQTKYTDCWAKARLAKLSKPTTRGMVRDVL